MGDSYDVFKSTMGRIEAARGTLGRLGDAGSPDDAIEVLAQSHSDAAAPMVSIEAARRAIEGYGPPPDRIYMRPEVYAAAIGKAGGQHRARPCKLARRCAARGRG
jgi:hypothetical protein